ncbi:hypothetical protein [Hydrococcus rivularis]|uniref:hypothetical protein n=1 Tax=Hydrococcus rivularis TaxID=1616834 RepID=UPI000A5565CA|nr:hypothetical protein [Hydrococcus rivularis]
MISTSTSARSRTTHLSPLVFFDIKGVEVPLKNGKTIEFREFESAQTLLPKLIKLPIANPRI